MVGVRATFNASGLLGALKRVQGIAHSPEAREAMELVGATLAQNTRERFETQTSPDGIRWPPSARAAKQAGKTLLSGRVLQDSITHIVTSPTTVEIGTNWPYAATHQYGATIRPKKAKFLVFTGVDGEKVFAKEVKIPARPFLGITAADREEIEEAIAEVVRDMLQP